jgi:hypothetical protein
MALVLADRVRDTTTTTGTGTVTLSGTPPTGFQSFTSGIGNGNTTFYTIAGQGTSEWEVGLGTYTSSGTTLSRDTVLASSNSGSLVNFSAGTKDVFCDYPAGRSVNRDANGYISYDFTNSTLTSRVNFQTSTANSTTGIYALPSGSATAASWQATNASDPTNASKILIATNGTTDVQLVSGRNGSGAYLPLSFYTNGVQNAQLDTSGNFSAVGNVAAGNGLLVNTNTVSVNYSIPSGSNAMSAGPVSVNSGISVTVPSGSVWTVI